MKVKCQNSRCKAMFNYKVAIENTSYECPYPKCPKCGFSYLRKEIK